VFGASNLDMKAGRSAIRLPRLRSNWPAIPSLGYYGRGPPGAIVPAPITYETVTTKFAEADGVRFAYRRFGNDKSADCRRAIRNMVTTQWLAWLSGAH
jgi:hypothetical protein